MRLVEYLSGPLWLLAIFNMLMLKKFIKCRPISRFGLVSMVFQISVISIILMIYCSLQINQRDLNVAIIGQSTFAAEVYKLLLKNGHRVVGVFTILDKGNRQDPLGRYQLISCSYAIYIIDLKLSKKIRNYFYFYLLIIIIFVKV